MHDRDRLDGVAAIFGEPSLDALGVGAGAPVAFQDLDVQAEAPRHRSVHSVEKCPVSLISTVSPGESVFTSAASQAPVPDDGKIRT